MPDFVEEEYVNTAVKTVLAKKQLKTASRVELCGLSEGKCVQIMHTGSFENEPETLAILQNFVEDNNFIKNGLHHEIYLSDFNKTPPHKLKTILREPVK